MISGWWFPLAESETKIPIEMIYLKNASKIGKRLEESRVEKREEIIRWCLWWWSRNRDYKSHWFVLHWSEGAGLSQLLSQSWISQFWGRRNEIPGTVIFAGIWLNEHMVYRTTKGILDDVVKSSDCTYLKEISNNWSRNDHERHFILIV